MIPILVINLLLHCFGDSNFSDCDKIFTASHTYVHVLSLCHLYSFTGYLKHHKCELPKDTCFLVQFFHNCIS
jgi:hypothetical protein